jgi:hypothetical protein
MTTKSSDRAIGKVNGQGRRRGLRRLAPALVLFLLAPLVAEVIFGSTPVSNIGALLPSIPLYGGGALLIRELVHRRGGGWWRIALLGAAFAVVEEGLALQSMFDPALFGAGGLGGRWLGVNWVWTQWTVGYHVIWSISVPILLAELLFPARRHEAWLGRVGVSVVGALYALGALALAAIFRLFVTPDFRASAVLMIGAALLVCALVALALRWSSVPAVPAASTAGAPSPWLMGLISFASTAAWFGLLHLPETLRSGAVVLAPMALEIILAAGVAALIRRWSASRGWNDAHRLALAFGAILTSTLYGVNFVTAGSPGNQIGEGVASAVTLALLAFFVRHRHAEQKEGGARLWSNSR